MTTDELQAIVESLARTSENLLIATERNTSNINTLTRIAQNHEERIAQNEVLLRRLDTLIEQFIYREGRQGDAP